jgi:hypothetical protein
MVTVTGQQVADFLGQGDDTNVVVLAEQHVDLVTAFVRAYTRGRGFEVGEPDEDLAAVIVTATARLVSNPTHAQHEQIGDYGHRPGTLEGWTLPELAVLHLYRKRAG